MLDNDFAAPNMDIVRMLMKFEKARGTHSRRRREHRYTLTGPVSLLAPAPPADLRTSMTFLIANMSKKIPANPFKTHNRILSNRQFFGRVRSELENLIPKTVEAPPSYTRIVRSTKGEFVPA
jgi:hypothetical protein